MDHLTTGHDARLPACDAPRAPSRTASRYWYASLALLPLLSACNDDYDCWDCGPSIAPEVSLGLVAGDFQHTGRTSVIATSTVLSSPFVNRGNLKLYTLPGAATTAPQVIADGHDPLYLGSADLNADGLLDVVSASYSDGVLAVFLNTPGTPGTFGVPLLLPSQGASQLAIGDINADGLPDLVSADFNVSLFLQASPGNFSNPVALYPGGANWVAVGDLNGDGLTDVALTDAVGVKVLFQGTGTPLTFATPVSVYSESSPTSIQGANLIAIADVNGDGLNDLVLTDPGPGSGSAPVAVVLAQDPAHVGSFLPAVTYPILSYQATSIVVTDVNGDGFLDIVVGGTLGVTVLLQSPTAPGTFPTTSNYTVQDANQIAVADVNADGLPDIIVGTGISMTPVNGIYPNQPGVLLQSTTAPGTFGTLQALP